MSNKTLFSCIFLLNLLLPLPLKADTNSIGMEFVKIPTGCFMMGRDANFEDGNSNELPRHKVCIDNEFYLGKYEVTQAQWVSIMGNNPSEFKGRSNPVEKVSWDDAKRFIQRLNKKEGTTKYRLPSEAQWEYAARAGSSSTYSFGDDKGNLGAYAWFSDNSGKRTHPVGEKRANKWGLHDMHGNVWEWVEDAWHDNYRGAPTNGRVWSGGDTRYRVLRGGSWDDVAFLCRSVISYSDSPDGRNDYLGFRVLRMP